LANRPKASISGGEAAFVLQRVEESLRRPFHLPKVRKMSCRAIGNCYNGVILRALGRRMRRLKTRHPRSLPSRSILIVAGALMLIAAFAPRENAQLIAYFNFEGPPTPPYPINMVSDPLGFVSTTLLTNYTTADISAGPGIPLNVDPNDMDPNRTSLGLRRSSLNNGRDFDIQLFSAQGFFQNMTLSFATNGNGNGFTAVQLSYSTNGGATFTAGPSALLTQQPQVVSLAVPVGANNAPLLVLRLAFSGGQSNGNDLQTIVDNIQVNGTIVPEPATIAGGLLGVLGLCWHQRRRLIRLKPLRLRRT